MGRQRRHDRWHLLASAPCTHHAHPYLAFPTHITCKPIGLSLPHAYNISACLCILCMNDCFRLPLLRLFACLPSLFHHTLLPYFTLHSAVSLPYYLSVATLPQPFWRRGHLPATQAERWHAVAVRRARAAEIFCRGRRLWLPMPINSVGKGGVSVPLMAYKAAWTQHDNSDMTTKRTTTSLQVSRAQRNISQRQTIYCWQHGVRCGPERALCQPVYLNNTMPARLSAHNGWRRRMAHNGAALACAAAS